MAGLSRAGLGWPVVAWTGPSLACLTGLGSFQQAAGLHWLQTGHLNEEIRRPCSTIEVHRRQSAILRGKEAGDIESLGVAT